MYRKKLFLKILHYKVGLRVLKLVFIVLEYEGDVF